MLRTARLAALSSALCCALIGATAGVASAAVSAHGSTGEAYVLGAAQGQALTLADTKGRTVAKGAADSMGSYIFRDVAPGSGYTVRSSAGRTRAFKVLRPGENPPAAFYQGKVLHKGLNYVTTRDGVELAMTVRLPAGKTIADGPFPTVIEYSGYQTAAPHDLAVGASDPLAPASSTVVGALIAPLLGFATVSVQMRGSGCSGGAFDLFGYPTTYDGYDAVETVAAQSWVKGGKVGMVGISFSGITQLFVAGTRPPHLAAIAPLSVTDDTYQGTGFPGGIQNSGFATSWVTERMDDAKPAPAGGQPWAKALTTPGPNFDQHCADNQKLRLQTQDALKLQKQNPYRTPSLYQRRAPGPWLKNVTVPVFLVGAFQDEQTGGHFPESLGLLKSNRNVWISLQNGVHADSLGPVTITRWVDFLNIFVADQVPKVPPTVLSLGSQLYKLLADAPASPVEQSRFANASSVAEAKAGFIKDPRVRLMMDNGAGAAGPGSIGSTWEIGLSAWPPKEQRATTWYLGAKGALSAARPKRASTTSYVADPKARPKFNLPDGGEAWLAQPHYNWAPLAAGKGVGWTSPVLGKDVVIAGPSSMDLYLKSTARDTDLQVTLSEVRPDGNETYVQNGWLRASHRKLDARTSTALDPNPTHLKKDGAPLPKGAWTLVRVPVFPVAHAFRAGSRIRVSVEAVGGDRAIWDFATLDKGTTRNTIALGGARASRLVLPVLNGITAKGTPLPAPTALRGEPNRTYTPAANGG